MNKQEKALATLNGLELTTGNSNVLKEPLQLAISALEKQIPKKVYHFLEDDTFETTCCGCNVTNQDFNYCPTCGQSLGKIEEVEGKDE